MALRFAPTDPFLRASIGAFNGYAWRANPSSAATLINRNAISNWHGVYMIDEGTTTNYAFPMEFNPSNQLVGALSPGSASFTSAATFTDITNWCIFGYTWDGTTTAGSWVWRWKIGAAAWQSETDTVSSGIAASIGSSYRHLIGNEAGLGDDAEFDWTCTGSIKSNLSQASFESLTMTDIASWDAVFTGSTAWLLDGETLATRTDRTGNGGNEVSRSPGITLVSDPAGWSWGGAAPAIPPILVMARTAT